MQGFSGAEPSSEKILQRLRDIKKVYNNDGSIYTYNPAIQSHQMSTDSQQSKLKKYFSDSVPREAQYLEEEIVASHITHLKYNDHQAFKKQLESKLETLFNEEKSLLRNRYDMNDEEYDIKKTGQNVQKQSLLAMERKVKQLENKYLSGKPQKPKGGRKINKQLSKKNVESPHQEQINQLKQALFQTKLLNQRLQNRLLKQKRNKSTSKDKIIHKLSNEINNLKKQLKQLKNRQDYPYVICPARIKSRQRAFSSFVDNHKIVERSILTQLYSQVQDMQFKVSKQQRQRLDLQEKNAWLESQLKKFIN